MVGHHHNMIRLYEVSARWTGLSTLNYPIIGPSLGRGGGGRGEAGQWKLGFQEWDESGRVGDHTTVRELLSFFRSPTQRLPRT